MAIWLCAGLDNSMEGSQSSTSPAVVLSLDEDCWHCFSERFWRQLAPGKRKTEITRYPYQDSLVLCSPPLTFPHALLPVLGSKVSQELQNTKPCLAQAGALLAMPWCMAEHPSSFWVITAHHKLYQHLHPVHGILTFEERWVNPVCGFWHLAWVH